MDETLQLLLRAAMRSRQNWDAFAASVPPRFVHGLAGVVYDLLSQAVHELGEPPSPTGMMTRVREWAATTGNLTSDLLDEVEQLVAYDGPVLSLAEIRLAGFEYSAELYKRETSSELAEADPGDVGRVLKDAAAGLDGLKPTNYLSAQEMAASWLDVHNRPAIQAHRTGVDFIDKFITGLVNGYTYSYLGPTGSAKTSLGIQLAVTYALKLRDRWLSGGRKTPLGQVFYVTTEDGLNAIQLRMLSHGAVVDRDRLSGKSKIPLTTKDTLSPDDRKLTEHPRFKAAFSETDRVRMMQRRFQDNLKVIDLRDDSIIPRGVHPITYIQQQIDRAVNTADNNTYCALVIIDHCETLIGRLRTLADKGMSRWEVIEKLPEDIRDQLATHFDCPVWAVHQVSGQANEKGTTARINHTDGKGSKSWGTYFHVCFSISKVDRENNQCRLQITKNRDGAILPDKTLRLLGNIGTLEEVKDKEGWPEDGYPEGRRKPKTLKNEIISVKRKPE